MDPDPSETGDLTPQLLRKSADFQAPTAAEVGDFRQGSPLSQWALGRYLVGRALTESVGTALLIVALVVLALAAVAEWALHSTVLAVLVVIVALGVLLLRWILLTVVRRLTDFRQFAPIERRMTALVGATRSDVLRELRRVGLPGRAATLPLLAFRLVSRRRRKDTLARLRLFEAERAVPKGRLDELHLLLRQVFGGRPTPGAGPAVR